MGGYKGGKALAADQQISYARTRNMRQLSVATGAWRFDRQQPACEIRLRRHWLA